VTTTGKGARVTRAGITMVAAILVATASGCSSEDDQPEPPASVVTSRPAMAFAPLVHLYESEAARPISAADFIDYSSLTMANEPCYSQETVAIGEPRLRLKRDEPAPALDSRRLGGSRPYRQRMRSADCSGHQRRAYASSQHTRPYDPGRRLRPHEGYYLDLLTSRLPGTADYSRDGDRQLQVSRAPVYYERRAEQVDSRPAIRITYWLLFGLDGYPNGTAAAYALMHEGDWERVSVVLRSGGGPDRWRPVSVGYRIHGRWRDVPWMSVEVASADDGRAPTHPVVYAARGNHAPYPDQGRTVVRHEIDGAAPVRAADERHSCSDCPRWTTWTQLRPVNREPWYGYGGAWGAVGPTPENSGPIGPSPYTR
jgi:hypothetical protein